MMDTTGATIQLGILKDHGTPKHKILLCTHCKRDLMGTDTEYPRGVV